MCFKKAKNLSALKYIPRWDQVGIFKLQETKI